MANEESEPGWGGGEGADSLESPETLSPDELEEGESDDG